MAARRGRRKNNGAELDELEQAQTVTEGFHGRGVNEVVDIEEQHQYRSELAQLGELVELEVYCRNLPKLLVLTFNRHEPVCLSSSANRKQLFLIGGDSELDEDLLNKVSPNSADKDIVQVGWVYSISYFADKHHLTGPKQQAKGTEYIHEFGEQSFKKADPEQKIEGGALPCLLYDRLNKAMSFVGGIYDVRDEGIWD